MDNLAFIPLGVLLFLFIRMSAKRAVFYKHQSGKKELIDHVRWYHYVIYYVWVSAFTLVILIPFFPRINEQIAAFYALHTGHRFVYTSDNGKMGKDLPDGEFLTGYETLRNINSDELINEIIPSIIEYQRGFQQQVPHSAFEGYNLSRDFTLEYDTENDKFLLWLDREIAGEILVENTWFFKRLYFHYYRDVLVK
ncbi:MAG: hypothetical protein J1E83_13425 [Lachnospiraceae bacterium]|nr:hypothetical protein [Lachnospiraceae bacterium]